MGTVRQNEHLNTRRQLATVYGGERIAADVTAQHRHEPGVNEQTRQ